jgi:hypothetical protein
MSTSLGRRAAMTAIGLAMCGCTALAGEMRDATDEELAESSMVEAGDAWESAPAVRSLWITLPSYTPIRIAHGLGREPVLVLPYLSYTKDDSDSSAERQYSIGAGDVATISDVTEDSLTIQNRSYAKFYVRVVLQ